jgi:hypothetical protein
MRKAVKFTLVGGAGVLVLLSLLSTAAEAQFQAAWRSDLGRATSHVEWFYNTYSRLPVTLMQAVDDTKNPRRGASWFAHLDRQPVREIEWLQYRRLNDHSYQLWVARSDLSFREPKSQPRDVAPTAQDVWCTFDVTGKRLATSRLWYW